MNKIISFLLSMFLIVNMAGVVSAEETTAPETNLPHEHSWTITDTATCTAAGTVTKTCTCGAVETAESPAKGHSYGSLSKVDDANHKTVCSACQDEVVSAHSWDGGTETTQATCKQAGVKTYTCTGCGATKTESIPVKTTHNFGDWDGTETTHTRTCRDCGKTESGSHSWGSGTVTRKPTCKEDGIRTYTCSGCSMIRVENIAKLTTHTYDSACDSQCNVCAATRTIEHTFTTIWSKNYNSHWHECTKCGEKKDEAKHVPGPGATEDKDQVCLTCGYVITAKKEHKHTYETEWTSDEVGHWHACTGKTCEVESGYAAHVYDNACDPDCNTCGYERQDSHSYDTDGWLTSSFEHWNICAVCGEESKHEKHIAGPEATETDAQVCTVCSYELAPKLEHNHDFGPGYIVKEDSHWQECKCGELSVPEPHVWDNGTKNKNKTVTYSCTLCGAEKTEEAKAGFPWLILVMVILMLICIGGIVAIVLILKRGDDAEEDDDSENLMEEETEEEDPEEKLITDYFTRNNQDSLR